MCPGLGISGVGKGWSSSTKAPTLTVGADCFTGAFPERTDIREYELSGPADEVVLLGGRICGEDGVVAPGGIVPPRGIESSGVIEPAAGIASAG